MLQVARLAPRLLQESTNRVAEFFLSQFNEDGGAKDRSGNSDLYYTVFALEGLVALERPFPAITRNYLESFGDGETLDLVHICCLARCWSTLGEVMPVLGERIKSLWVPNSIYHTFLAVGAMQDIGIRPNPEALDFNMDVPTVPTTAAAVTLFRHLDAPVPHDAVEYLLSCSVPAGGFLATREAPMPDLLSTATALHALSGENVSFADLKENTLDFIDTLWTGTGFCGNWMDNEQDCEYTYYGLLALGHLSVA